MKELLTVKDLQKYLGKSIRIREDLLNDWILKNTNKGEEYKW